jgi:O-antigen/teichoic acid export membrane protein
MSLVKRNIVANFGSTVWAGLMSLIFVPVYIYFIGIEAYGLVGVFSTLLALFGVLDMGLSTTLNREMARLSVQLNKASEMRDLMRTLEIPYWVIGSIIGAIIALMAPLIADHWVNVEDLSPDSVKTAITLIGFVIAFQWSNSIYSGALLGLQQQVLLSGINSFMASLRGIGAVIVLWQVSPTVEAFFWWQLIVSIIHVSSTLLMSWRRIPSAAGRPRFRPELLRNIWQFAAGMAGITVLVTILMQLDKVILSRMLSLEMFGYYTLASVVAVNLTRIVTPVFSAIYPRLTSMVELGSITDITKLYHQSAQLISVIVLPVALVLAMFSKEVLFLWTQDVETAENTYKLLSILTVGTAINGLMYTPYALQLSHGWTKLALVVNAISAVILIPALIVITNMYGATGAASIWVALNLSYMFISLPIIHRRLLPTETLRWYRDDVGRPLLAAAVVAGIGRYIIQPDWPSAVLIVCISILSVLTLLSAGLAANKLDAQMRIKTFLRKI